MKNPFLTTDVYHACQQAKAYYLNTLARLQENGGQTVELLDYLQSKSRGNLELGREQALQAARQGDVGTAIVQLTLLVMEWGVYKALDDLLTSNVYLDGDDAGLQADFVRLMGHKMVLWATELTNEYREGEQERENDQVKQSAQRHAEVFEEHRKMAEQQRASHKQMSEEQRALSAQVHQFQQQVIQGQQAALSQAHQAHKLYGDVALDGVKQAQQGAHWMMQGVVDLNKQAAQNVHNYQLGVQQMYTHGQQVMIAAAHMQKAATENMKEHLPEALEKVQGKAERRKWFTRGVVVLVALLSGPVAISIAWTMLRVLLHF